MSSNNPKPKRGFEYQNAHWLWLSAGVFLVDQVTKRLIINNLGLFDRIPLLGIFNITHMQNTGVAFSLMADSKPWVFVVLACVVALGIIFWLHKHRQDQRLVAVSLCLILGGALANAVDRVLYGYVIDFLDFHIGQWHYPAFNIADCAIVIGAFLLILDTLLQVRRKNNKYNP